MSKRRQISDENGEVEHFYTHVLVPCSFEFTVQFNDCSANVRRESQSKWKKIALNTAVFSSGRPISSPIWNAKVMGKRCNLVD